MKLRTFIKLGAVGVAAATAAAGSLVLTTRAVKKLEYKAADKSALETALSLTLDKEYPQYYDAELLAAWEALVAEGQEMYDNDELTILDNEAVKAMATEIINAHNENINCISTEGVGTEFIFTLPLVEE